MLTGVFDVDVIILNKLTDEELEIYCSADSYAAKLLDRDAFWISRIKTKYPTLCTNDMAKLRSNHRDNWKAAYYNIKESTYYLHLGPWENSPEDLRFKEVREEESNFRLNIVGDNEAIRGFVYGLSHGGYFRINDFNYDEIIFRDNTTKASQYGNKDILIVTAEYQPAEYQRRGYVTDNLSEFLYGWREARELVLKYLDWFDFDDYYQKVDWSKINWTENSKDYQLFLNTILLFNIEEHTSHSALCKVTVHYQES